MNKTAIKNFAVWARKKLIADITYKAGLIGVSENGIVMPLSQSTKDMQFFDIGTKNYAKIADDEITQRDVLVAAIKAKERDTNYNTAFQNVVEEVAYTWFNRLIAVRFMEVNDYLPSRVRILSSKNPAKLEPDFVTTPFRTDLVFTPYEQDRVLQLKDENKLNELFRMLFIKQCNKLHEILPELFEKTADYSELLLTISFTDKDGVVYHLTHISDTPEDDFNVSKEGQVEIIGWMYQYYNTEPKDEVFALLKKNVKITKERIPAATQLFTPDWIVRYMVENSLGRLWLEQLETQKVFDFEYVDFANFSFGESNDKDVTKKQDSLKSKWKYYLNEAKQDTEVEKELYKQRMNNKNYDITTLKLIDPCMGSGHILVYAFDVFMQIYESQGYTTEDAAQSIVEHNLYGLDINDRAYQLAYFAIMMKARQYNSYILDGKVCPHVYSIQESNSINRNHLKYMGDNVKDKSKWQQDYDELCYIIDFFQDANEYGSSLNPKRNVNFRRLYEFRGNFLSSAINLETIGIYETSIKLFKLIGQYAILSQIYDVVVTNPPYMGNKGMSKELFGHVQKNYPDSKSDLFAVFIERCLQMTKSNGYTAMITQHAFMFLSSYEKLRGKLLHTDFINMAHLGARAFEEIGGEVVQTTSFVMRKSHTKDYKGTYARLVDYNSQQGKEEAFLAKKDLHTAQQENFKKIPGSPIAYWASEKMLSAFERGRKFGDVADSKQGLATADNNRFLREWFEVDNRKIKFDATNRENAEKSREKWFPYNKGGEFRKWYGNNDYVVNWENDGLEIRNFLDDKGKLRSVVRNPNYYFKESASWSLISSSMAAFRYKPYGYIFDVAGMSLFSSNNLKYLLALCNTPFAMEVLKIIAPTINYQCGDIANIPVIISNQHKPHIDELVEENISISKIDWDSFQTSWDFVRHPLLCYGISLYSGLGDGKKPPISEMSVVKSKTSFRIYERNAPKSYTIRSAFEMFEEHCEKQFNQLKSNEEELNRIFIDIYGLQDELTPEVADKDVTVRRADLQRDIKSLISYAVGCMFGRYSLDREGLVFAGGDFDKTYWRYKGQAALDDNGNPIEGGYAGISLAEYHYPKFKDTDNWETATSLTFEPDADNVLPITDEDYFHDDIVGRFVEFIKTAYGAETLEENLDFIAKAIGNKGNTSREIIRNYFLNDFIKDHIKIYQKRPIYWMFDSGKQNGFKALIYMHRYNKDTTGKVRVDYLHKVQKVYESEIDRMQEIIENSTNGRDVADAEKRKEKLTKQLKEAKDYDAKIAHLALSRIDIDFDDGVKVNYEKVQTGQDGKKIEILTKI